MSTGNPPTRGWFVLYLASAGPDGWSEAWSAVPGQGKVSQRGGGPGTRPQDVSLANPGGRPAASATDFPLHERQPQRTRGRGDSSSPARFRVVPKRAGREK